MTPIKKVVSLGGGTAGWLTAGRIAAQHRAHENNNISVTLIESPNIPTTIRVFQESGFRSKQKMRSGLPKQ